MLFVRTTVASDKYTLVVKNMLHDILLLLMCFT